MGGTRRLDTDTCSMYKEWDIFTLLRSVECGGDHVLLSCFIVASSRVRGSFHIH